MPGLKHAERLELADGLAQRAAGGSELIAERGFRGQLLTGRQLSGGDQPPELGNYVLFGSHPLPRFSAWRDYRPQVIV